MKLRNAVVIDGVRTAFTKGGRGKLEAARLDDLGAVLIRALFERNLKVKPTMIEDLGIGGNLGRGVGHLAGLPAEAERRQSCTRTPAMTTSNAENFDSYDSQRK